MFGVPFLAYTSSALWGFYNHRLITTFTLLQGEPVKNSACPLLLTLSMAPGCRAGGLPRFLIHLVLKILVGNVGFWAPRRTKICLAAVSITQSTTGQVGTGESAVLCASIAEVLVQHHWEQLYDEAQDCPKLSTV